MAAAVDLVFVESRPFSSVCMCVYSCTSGMAALSSAGLQEFQTQRGSGGSVTGRKRRLTDTTWQEMTESHESGLKKEKVAAIRRYTQKIKAS